MYKYSHLSLSFYLQFEEELVGVSVSQSDEHSVNLSENNEVVTINVMDGQDGGVGWLKKYSVTDEMYELHTFSFCICQMGPLTI